MNMVKKRAIHGECLVFFREKTIYTKYHVSYMLSQIIFPQTYNMCPSSMLVCTRHAYQSAKHGKYLNYITVYEKQ